MRSTGFHPVQKGSNPLWNTSFILVYCQLGQTTRLGSLWYTSSMDIEQRRAYDRAYHAKRTPEAKAKKLALQETRKLANTLAIRAYKASKGCMDCGESDPIVLELDHRERSEKKFAIADSSRVGMSLESLMKEAEKCDVVCANCHRRRTAKQMKWRT